MTNAAWSPKIKENAANKLYKLMKGILPAAKNFVPEIKKEIRTTKGGILTYIYKATDDSNEVIGWSFICTGRGFADKIELIVAVDKNFEKFIGYDVLYAAETPGFGNKIASDYFKNQFRGANAGDLELVKTGDNAAIDNKIVAISGATVSSTAVVNTLNNYLEQIKKELVSKGLIQSVK
jgi:electron transport complex protein RnfG